VPTLTNVVAVRSMGLLQKMRTEHARIGCLSCNCCRRSVNMLSTATHLACRFAIDLHSRAPLIALRSWHVIERKSPGIQKKALVSPSDLTATCSAHKNREPWCDPLGPREARILQDARLWLWSSSQQSLQHKQNRLDDLGGARSSPFRPELWNAYVVVRWRTLLPC
jgi:hypothetical protein